MSTLKRLLCLLFALSLCLTLLASCSGKKDNDPKDTDDEEESVEDTDDNTETVDPSERDELEESYSFGEGTQDFSILLREDTKYEYVSENYMGDPVKQAVYERNEEVMERCNIEFNFITQAGDWDNRESFMTTIRNNALITTSEYDLIVTHAPYLMTVAVEGVGYDITDVAPIDVTKRWWSEPFYRDANYNGSIYIMIGDIGYTLYEHIEVIFFNEQMAEDLELGDLYDVALDGDWTWELFKEYVLKVTTDMDAAPENRIYGYLSTGQAHRTFPVALGTEIAYQENGVYSFPLILKDPILSIVSAYSDFVLQTPQVLATETNITRHDVAVMFGENKGLFYADMLGEAIYLKQNMENDYGVLPFPKWNDSQVEYRTSVEDNMNAILIPTNVDNLPMTGTVCEMMSMLGFRTISQEYYEEALKYQAFNNPDCVETLEMIRRSLTMPFSMAYSCPLGTPHSLVSNYINSGGDVSISTYYSTTSMKWSTNLKTLYEALDLLEARDAS